MKDPRGLAPAGWHVASDAEWTTLTTFLGGENLAGGKLKSTGTIEVGDGLWYSPNIRATNEVGFSALPGGWRDNGYCTFGYFGGYGYWWSFEEISTTHAWGRGLGYNDDDIGRGDNGKEFGFSVRCIRD